MTAEMTLPPCGACCNNCSLYKKKCDGCIETNGKPFYVKEAGKDVCPVFTCVGTHKITHCGLCSELPCDKFLGWYDPKRGVVTALRRTGLLLLRKKVGDRAWLKWIKEKKVTFGS